MILSEIYIHPLKSGKSISLQESLIYKSGLENDRLFGVVDNEGKVITAREYPKLLQFKVVVEEGKFLFGKEKITFDELCNNNCLNSYKLFDTPIKAYKLNAIFSQLISDFLGVKCDIIKLKQNSRCIATKYNSTPNNMLNLADVSPVHLISASSLYNLNNRLSAANKVVAGNFRPNLVVKGNIPFAEDIWKTIQIGKAVFDVHCQTTRCGITLLSPTSSVKNKFSQPLSSLRKNNSNEVCFGIYLIPRANTQVKIDDSVKVIA